MKKKNSLITDLTPLLDVILIILFMVLVSGHEKTAARITELERSNRVLIKREEELEKIKSPVMDSEKNWYVVYNSGIGKAELYFPDDFKTGRFRLIRENGENSVKPETEEFESWLISEIKKLPQDVVILTFRYRDTAIYWRDFEKVSSMLNGMSEKTGKKIIMAEFPL